MGKRFRTDHLDQGLLLPPSLHDWLPEGHLARFIADVIEELDLGAVYRAYGGDGRGLAAYQPSMMVRLLLYGYCQGVVSSRKIERATHEDVAFRYLSADTHPDHDTIAAFRKRHLTALAGLFAQALQLCRKAGLVKLGHVAIDGTKIKANASKHKAMSYERMEETEQRLRQEVEELLRRAEETDAAEDAQYGKGKRGDELPEELARRESRLVKIRAAKAALEQEAKEKAERQRAEAEAKIAERREQEERTGKKAGGHDPKVPDPEQAKPEAKAQRNFTDPESRIMLDGANKGSFIQAYNAQAAVDSQTQVIVAAEITQAANDSQQLAPMIGQVIANMGRKPEAVSADAGYWSEANVTGEGVAGIDLHIATGRRKHGEPIETATGPPPEEASVQEAMRHKLRTEAGQAIYKMRKAIVEPVFGQTKERRGFRRFSFRGMDNVCAEWKLICLTHNLLKLFRSGWVPAGA
ncbi:MAG: transposase [Lentisphaerae bacterium RIFOXYA12_64_32]|nr:MAG: transposase [Lentisphaerae bacterium RIFOXYA12_64_32]